ncbi:hypothetical protein [Methylocapsa palsarum]|uniref:Uncharacterized protein n=1 Tax=Methylocapsa palsarum TaxID=1612308 RepID=A0A1I4BK40_9HYPH|nr:hypothetical protein [Methylocapsa palsarum]SFK69085.1 hypothetical protein SAMN05444581_11558 [Methylocapsa palsarum]
MNQDNLGQKEEGGLQNNRLARLALKELPYIGALFLTILGVAYTSVSRQPLTTYWEFLAVFMAIVCVTTGWLHVQNQEARMRMLWTQAFHWVAFLVAMNIVLLPSVQAMLTAPATGLTLLMLLALGTFVAGVHIAWQICVLGIIMAIAVPVIAWLTQSVLFLLLAFAGIIGIVIIFRSPRGEPKVSSARVENS